MNSIRNGQVYQATRSRSGENWEMLVTRDEKGQHEIVVYVNNRPSHVEEGSNFKILDIEGVSFGSKQDQKGNWRPMVRMYANVEPS